MKTEIGIGIELLEPNHAGVFRLKNGETINYGVIRFEGDKNERLVYYTGIALKEIWSAGLSKEEQVKADRLKKQTENELINAGYIQIVPVDDIAQVLF